MNINLWTINSYGMECTQWDNLQMMEILFLLFHCFSCVIVLDSCFSSQRESEVSLLCCFLKLCFCLIVFCFIDIFYKVKKVSFYSYLAMNFYHERTLNLIKYFSSIFWNDDHKLFPSNLLLWWFTLIVFLILNQP